MLNRRKVLFAAALMAAALPAMPVMASDSRLLADILAGVSDALTRDYIRRHYQEGRWDGSHWNYGGPDTRPPSTAATGRSTTRSAASRRSRPVPRSRRSVRSIRSIRSRSPVLRPAGILRRGRATTTAGTKDAKTTGGATTVAVPGAMCRTIRVAARAIPAD